MCAMIGLIITAILLVLVFKIFFLKKNKEPKILETNFKQNVVYLYQFPIAETVRNVSPFCLKLECFLRVNNIQYENRFIWKERSQQGKVPFVELNGTHIADSQLIEEKLKLHFNLKPYANKKDEAVARAVARMVSHHTSPVFSKYKVYDDPRTFVDTLFNVFNFSSYASLLKTPITWVVKSKFTKRLADFGLFTDEEFGLLLRKDLTVLSDLLDNDDFFFGNTIGNLDASVFGHLASNYYMPKTNEVGRVLNAEYPPLVKWMERVKDTLFKDDFVRITL